MPIQIAMRILGNPLASVAGTSFVLFATCCCAAHAISCACTAVAVCALSCIFCTVPTVTFLAVSAAACTATLVPAVAAPAVTVAVAFTVSTVAVLAACCAPARATRDTASEVLLYAVLDAALYDACTVFPARDVDRHGELFANGCTPRSTGLFLLFRTARLISLVTASLTAPAVDFARPTT